MLNFFDGTTSTSCALEKVKSKNREKNLQLFFTSYFFLSSPFLMGSKSFWCHRKKEKVRGNKFFFVKKNVYLSKKTFKKRNVSLRGKFSQKMQNSEELPKMANRMRGLHVARFSLLFLFWFGDLKSAKLKTKIVISPCKLSRITKWFQTCLFNEKISK